MLPAVVYGRSVSAQPLTLTAAEFLRVHRAAGESTLIDLDVAGATPLHVLIQDIAYDPVRGVPTHVDFRAVSMTETIETHIPLRFVGIAPAVASGTGVLVKQLDRLDVEARPDALVHEITVDLAPLAALDAAIHVRDLVIPPGITVRTRPDDVVALITELAAEEEAPAGPATVGEVEVVGEKEKAAAEAAAGAAAAEEKKEKKK